MGKEARQSTTKSHSQWLRAIPSYDPQEETQLRNQTSKRHQEGKEIIIEIWIINLCFAFFWWVKSDSNSSLNLNSKLHKNSRETLWITQPSKAARRVPRISQRDNKKLRAPHGLQSPCPQSRSSFPRAVYQMSLEYNLQSVSPLCSLQMPFIWSENE